MNTNLSALLERLRQPNAQDAWAQFAQVYSPLISYWARRAGVRTDDAPDLVQEVFATLIVKLPQFHYDPAKSFSGWLRTVTLNKGRQMKRRRSLPMLGADILPTVADNTQPGSFLETQDQNQAIGQAMTLVQAEFSPNVWKAFWESAVQGRPAAEVAAQLGLSVWTVYAAKSRVIKRLRVELAAFAE